MNTYASTFDNQFDINEAKFDALLKSGNGIPLLPVIDEIVESELSNLDMHENANFNNEMEFVEGLNDSGYAFIEHLNNVDEHALMDSKMHLINPDVFWTYDVKQSPNDLDFGFSCADAFDYPADSPQNVLLDFDMDLLLGGSNHVEEIQPSTVDFSEVSSDTEKPCAIYFATFIPETADSPFQFSSPVSPSGSEASTSSSGSNLSLSLKKPKSKRGRKPKNWFNPEFISGLIASTSDDKNKVKNNIASGQYRKRKWDARRELEEEIVSLEERNAILSQRFQKNLEWFKRAKLLFPHVNMPW